MRLFQSSPCLLALTEMVLTATGSLAQAAAAQMAAVLAKDAFLVFRALCKLSIRTADATTHTDLTALRGKVRRPSSTQQWAPWGDSHIPILCRPAHQQCS